MADKIGVMRSSLMEGLALNEGVLLNRRGKNHLYTVAIIINYKQSLLLDIKYYFT